MNGPTFSPKSPQARKKPQPPPPFTPMPGNSYRGRFKSVLLIGHNVHSNLLRLIRDGQKWRDGYLGPITYSLHCHHQNDSALRRAAAGNNDNNNNYYSYNRPTMQIF